MEGNIGEVRLFAGNFAPRAWAFCEGQLLAISQNTALFSILGTTYGGDGRTTFGLPDLRGRVAIAPGTGPGLSTHRLGARSGVETVTLTQNQMPSHSHLASMQGVQGVASIPAAADTASTEDPTNAVPAVPEIAGNNAIYADAASADTHLAPGAVAFAGAPTIGNSGGSQPFTNMQPYLALNYIICLQGVFPSRN